MSRAHTPTDEKDVIEQLLPEIVPTEVKAETNPYTEIPHPARPVVVTTAAGTNRYRIQPMSLLCPGCGAVQDRYGAGLPARLSRLDLECPTCDTTLQRWSSVAISTVYEAAPPLKLLREVTTDYWDESLWTGITTGNGNPRTEEFTQQYTNQAETFGWNWTVRCPLCRRELTELERSRLDYHHWRYEPDQGVCICRICHTAISADQCDAALDWKAQQLGLQNHHDLQLARLALREQAIAGFASLTPLVDRLHSRYNPVQSLAELYALLAQTLTDPAILEHLYDEHLLTGLPDERLAVTL